MLLKKMTLPLFCLLVLTCCLMPAVSALAGGGQEIKARMLTRLPVINTLKTQGVVGETSEGFLAFVGQKQPRAALVKAENADRLAVYTAIAKQQGASKELVGKRRGNQIAKHAAPGTWLRDAAGNWHRK